MKEKESKDATSKMFALLKGISDELSTIKKDLEKREKRIRLILPGFPAKE